MQKEKNRKMISYLLVFLYVLAGSLGMVLIKKGGVGTGVSFDSGRMTLSVSWVLFIGLISYAISFLLWIYILQLFPITYISPVSYGLVFISTAIFSYILLDIKITKEQIIGAIFIIAGIVIASKKR